jgi:hypothetical protein
MGVPATTLQLGDRSLTLKLFLATVRVDLVADVSNAELERRLREGLANLRRLADTADHATRERCGTWWSTSTPPPRVDRLHRCGAGV